MSYNAGDNPAFDYNEENLDPDLHPSMMPATATFPMGLQHPFLSANTSSFLPNAASYDSYPGYPPSGSYTPDPTATAPYTSPGFHEAGMSRQLSWAEQSSVTGTDSLGAPSSLVSGSDVGAGSEELPQFFEPSAVPVPVDEEVEREKKQRRKIGHNNSAKLSKRRIVDRYKRMRAELNGEINGNLASEKAINIELRTQLTLLGLLVGPSRYGGEYDDGTASKGPTSAPSQSQPKSTRPPPPATTLKYDTKDAQRRRHNDNAARSRKKKKEEDKALQAEYDFKSTQLTGLGEENTSLRERLASAKSMMLRSFEDHSTLATGSSARVYTQQPIDAGYGAAHDFGLSGQNPTKMYDEGTYDANTLLGKPFSEHGR